MRRRILLLAALLPLGACVATKQDVEQLRLDMAGQRAQQDSLFRVLIARTEAMLDSLSDQNVRLRGDFANRLLAIDRQLVQIQELSGQNQAQLAGLRQQIETSAAEARRAQEAAAAAARDGGNGGGEEEGGDRLRPRRGAVSHLRPGPRGAAADGAAGAWARESHTGAHALQRHRLALRPQPRGGRGADGAAADGDAMNRRSGAGF
jgi:hypothetical protein